MLYEKVPLIFLVRLCRAGNEEALKEWKRRWEVDYPKMGGAEDAGSNT